MKICKEEMNEVRKLDLELRYRLVCMQLIQDHLREIRILFGKIESRKKDFITPVKEIKNFDDF